MAIANVDEEIKGVLERIGSMCSRAESILNLCLLGFMKHNESLIDEAKKMSQSVHEEENELLVILSNMAKKEQEADKALIKSLVAVVGHIEMATTIMDGMLYHVNIKLSEGILFGDKAVNEVRQLFKDTLDVLKSAGDAILTKNEVLRKYINEKYEKMGIAVNKYSEEHEDRLVKGLCQPKSSSLYLNIVDSQMKIVWHIKQGIDRLFSQ